MRSSPAGIPSGWRRFLLIAALLAAAAAALPGCWVLRGLFPPERRGGEPDGAGPGAVAAPDGERPESAYDTPEKFRRLARELDGFFEAGIPIRSGDLEVVPLVGWRQDCPWAEGCLALEEAVEQGVLGAAEGGERGGFRLLILENTGAAPAYLLAGDVLRGPGPTVLLHGAFLPPGGREFEALAAPLGPAELGYDGGGPLLPGMPGAIFRADDLAAWGIHPRVEAAVEGLLPQLLGSRGTCGFAVLSGGELRAVELLHSGILFRSMAAKLLRASLLEALAAGEAAAPALASTPGEPVRPRPERNGGAEAAGKVTLTSLRGVAARILAAPERARRVERFPGGVAFEGPECSGQVLFHPGGSVLHYRAFYR